MSGGMSDVLICQDVVLERSVAIKFVNQGVDRGRVEDEVNSLFKLRSKHVVQIYDLVKTSAGEMGIVQELIEGSDLFEAKLVLDSPHDLCKILWQIAAGIADIHALGVIHRDIKPNNMKIDAEGILKIFDFGLARLEGGGAMTKAFIGTRGFAAPELYYPPYRFTQAVDTYAFGASALYLTLNGLPKDLLEQPPVHRGVSYFAEPLQHLPFLQDVVSLLDSCLNPNPAARPTMVAVRDALARYLLRDRHRALLVYSEKSFRLDSENRLVKLTFANVGEIHIKYDGFSFVVDDVAGEVEINNKIVPVGMSMPGASVISLGNAQRRANERKFITFDISHPEIVL